MPEHHNTRASRQKAERFFLKYACLPLGERSLDRLQAELREENISVSVRTLERYSGRYDWPGRLRQMAAEDQAAAVRRVKEVRIRRRERYYTQASHPEEWAAEQLSVAVHKICAPCASNLQGKPDQIRLCKRCTAQILPWMLALLEGPPAAAVLKHHFELEWLAEESEEWREAIRLAELELLKLSEPS
jgi:hypothetical protein